MPTTTAVDTLQGLFADLMQCVTALQSTYGDTPAMRRIVNDAHGIRNGIHRLQIDAEDLGLSAATIPCTKSTEMIQISDDDYDASFWRDVDHEGVGSQSLACAHAPRKRR
jgi:hypothetical protein